MAKTPHRGKSIRALLQRLSNQFFPSQPKPPPSLLRVLNISSEVESWIEDPTRSDHEQLALMARAKQLDLDPERYSTMSSKPPIRVAEFSARDKTGHTKTWKLRLEWVAPFKENLLGRIRLISIVEKVP